jgi:hypothetical protein
MRRTNGLGDERHFLFLSSTRVRLVHCAPRRDAGLPAGTLKGELISLAAWLVGG